ncbi:MULTISPECIES: hypothetical protein [unclassified Streptomyces]|uniref:hypothetical protein n=1 Tax=unclassified Streptomyces TaxID=2593676 RepID=UPI00364A1064
MPLWLTALVFLGVWALASTVLGLLLARLIHRSPAPALLPAVVEDRRSVLVMVTVTAGPARRG